MDYQQKLEKLGRLALSPSAPPGEQEAAAVAFFRMLRKNGHDQVPLSTAEPERPLRPQPTPSSRPMPEFVFPFGKYSGVLVKDVAEEDPEYCVWVMENVVGLAPSLKRAIRKALAETDFSI